VGNPLVHKALADIGLAIFNRGTARAECRLDRIVIYLRRDLRVLLGEVVVGKSRGHEAGAGEGEGDARGVGGDPAAAPLLGDVGRRPRTASGVEDEVAGVGGHEEATLDDLR
jgi:hypothetical protein